MNWDRIDDKWKQAKEKMKTKLTMKLFTGLKQIREFERLQLPFLKSIADFDIVIEIGYAEEQEQPLTLKQLLLLNISSRATVRRRLARLIEQGIIIRRKHANDQRASLLIISPSSVKLLGKYGGTLTAMSALHFTPAAESLSAGTG
jgi:DNA-binding MarR family transcriptional regulator